LVQDAVFNFETNATLDIAIAKEQDPTIKEFLIKTQASYSKYYYFLLGCYKIIVLIYIFVCNYIIPYHVKYQNVVKKTFMSICDMPCDLILIH